MQKTILLNGNVLLLMILNVVIGYALLRPCSELFALRTGLHVQPTHGKSYTRRTPHIYLTRHMYDTQMAM